MKYSEIRRLLPTVAYAWPGGYPLFSVCRDGGLKAARRLAAEYTPKEGA